ncbi:MAG: hypothetical protein ACRDQ4_15090 [Pseudonocardiaceae bacterium]
MPSWCAWATRPRRWRGIGAAGAAEAKRKALEAAYTDVVTADLPEWNQNSELLNWLADL